MIFAALGDTEAIGANCHFLKLDGTGLLLDVGLDPNEEGPASLPRFDLIRRQPDWYIDHAIVTHAHHDHMGALPVLLREFPHVLVHMTRVTRQLAELLLPASARLQRKRLLEGRSAFAPLFNEKQLEGYSYLYLTHEPGEEFNVTGLQGRAPVRARFYYAGHVLGAAGVLLTHEENGRQQRIFYTSDTNLRAQAIIPGGEYPEAPVDVLILESTAGADPEAERTTRKLEEERFGEAVRRVLDRGGSVLVPAFALGRAQEVLAVLDRLKREKVLPAQVPIYTAGTMRAIADLYDRTRFTTPRLDPSFEVFRVEQRRFPCKLRGVLEALQEPAIYVLSSGMMFERSLSNQMAQLMVENERHGIFLVGFSKEGSPARRLLEAAAAGAETVVLDEQRGPQQLRCEVARFRFSGHSHRRDLLSLVERLKPQHVLLVHGDEEARQWMADNIQFFYPNVQVWMPRSGEPLEL